MARQGSARGGRRRGVSAARFIHKFRRAAAARGPEVATTSYYSIPAIQVGQCEREEWGEVGRVYVSHTPQLVRGYPCTGPCSPEVAEVLQSHRRRSFGASHTTHRLDNLPSCHKHEGENDASMLARHDARWTLRKVVDFVLVTSFRKTRRPIKPRIMRHSIYHKDASPPRPNTASRYTAPVQGQFC